MNILWYIGQFCIMAGGLSLWLGIWAALPS